MSATLLLAALLAQSAAGETGDARQLERIRIAASRPAAVTIPAEPDKTGRPVFRVDVHGWTFNYKPWEDPYDQVPSYVRPSMPLSHYEFLQMVTPEAFRATTLYPGMIGMTLDLDARFRALAKWRRGVDERHAREEVRREFEAYLRARADSSK